MLQKFKKTLAVVMASTMLLAFTACNENTSEVPNIEVETENYHDELVLLVDENGNPVFDVNDKQIMVKPQYQYPYRKGYGTNDVSDWNGLPHWYGKRYPNLVSFDNEGNPIFPILNDNENDD